MNVQPVGWSIRDRVLSTVEHTLVMGVINATPDSFSDGGQFAVVGEAVAHGVSLWAQGADIVDVGGESTRPGAEPVSAAEEISRVVPIVSELVKRGVVISIDTTKPPVAEAAIAAGAHIVNDVTALGDPNMAAVCAEAGVGVVLMHIQGTPKTMQIDPRYEDVVSDVVGFLEQRAGLAQDAGIERNRICIDPGIGFGKTHDHNLALLDNINRLTATGYPVMIGTSRKGFLGAILSDAGVETSADERDIATAATVALAIAGGASVVRVHNVGHTLQSARVADAIVRVSQRRL